MIVMGSKVVAMFFTFLFVMLNLLPTLYACTPCVQPHPPYHRPPGYPKVPRPNPPAKKHPHPPHHGRYPPHKKPPVPPVVVPPIILPPPVIINPPPTSPYPPYTPSPPSGGGGGSVPGLNPPPITPAARCPIDALKLGLCLDVLGGLVHVGLGNPVENVCCPVLKGLLELEAAICLCTTIRLKLLNLNIFIPLALQVLITCGMTPPPGFVCPPL